MPVHILVSGDIHLGKRSSALPVDAAWGSSKYAWGQLVEYAIGNDVDAVFLTGDIVDRDNRYFEAVGTLQGGLKRLDEKGIAVFMVAGNHDYNVLSTIVEENKYPNVCLLGRDGNWEKRYFRKGRQAIQLIGWSFNQQHIRQNPVDLIDPDLIDPEVTTLALLHGDLFNSDSPYAPIAIDSLKRFPSVRGWVLGHVHKPECRQSATEPVILYPGSPLAMSPKEQGEHGPWLLTVDGSSVSGKQLPFSPVRYEQLTIELSEVTDQDTFRRLITTKLAAQTGAYALSGHLHGIVYDLVITGEYPDTHALETWGDAIKGYEGTDDINVSIRTVRFEVRQPLHVEGLVHDPSYRGVLARAILALEQGEMNPFIEQLQEEWIKAYGNTAQSRAFSVLTKQEETAALGQKARQALLTECRRLIYVLNNQKSHED